MATRAKKTPAAAKAKSKATKKTAVKKSASPKSSAAKAKTASTKKVVSKPANNPKSATVTTSVKSSSARKELTPLEKLRSLHILTFISFIALALVGFFRIGSSGSEVILSHQARDAFSNTDGVVLGNASEVLFSVDYRYLLVVSLALGAIGAILLASKLRSAYERTVNAGISGYRWLILGLSTAVLVELVSFVAGVQDLATLKVVGGLILLASLLGWLAERENSGAVSSKKVAYYGSIFAYTLALLPVAGSLIGTAFYGAERFGWHVYALVAVVIAGIVANLLIQKASTLKAKAKYEYVVYEQRFVRSDQIVKFLVVLILLLALR